jgi:hypothetical protein
MGVLWIELGREEWKICGNFNIFFFICIMTWVYIGCTLLALVWVSTEKAKISRRCRCFALFFPMRAGYLAWAAFIFTSCGRFFRYVLVLIVIAVMMLDFWCCLLIFLLQCDLLLFILLC